MTLRSGRWVWIVAAVLILVVPLVALGVYFANWSSDEGDPRASVMGPFIAVAAFTSGLILSVYNLLLARRQAAANEFRAARQALLDEVGHRAREFLGNTQVLRPAVMPLRWRRTSLPGVSSPPGSDAADCGDVADLYRTFAGQRLAILGEAGIGKTCAVNRMIVDLFDDQRRTGGGGPVLVPVLVGPQGWDPGKSGFESWLVDRIIKEYCRGEAERHSDRIGTLVRRGEILLFLDGLDDLPPAGRAAMLHELNRQETVTVVLCCRTGDYQEVASQQRLHGATVIELHALAGPEIIDYLRRCQADPPPAHWQSLLDELSDSPSSPLMQALANPLMLAILRDTHDSTHPLSVRDFPIRHAAEDELLDRFTAHAYTRRLDGKNRQPTAEQAGRTLGYLARRLEAKGRRQFGWWEIESLLPLPSRILCAAATESSQFGIIMALIAGLMYKSWQAFAFGFVFGVPAGLLILAPFGRKAKQNTPDPKRLTLFRPKAFTDGGRRRLNELTGKNLRWCAAWGAVALAALAGASLYLSPGYPNDPELPSQPTDVALFLLFSAVLGAVVLPAAFFLLVVFGALVRGLFDALLISVSEDGVHLDPHQIWRNDRKASTVLTTLLAGGLWFGGLVFDGIVIAGPSRLLLGLIYVVVGPLALAILFRLTDGSVRWTARVAFFLIRLQARSRVGGMPLLEDAHQRGILRAAGPRYEFRHARLQERLAAVGVHAESKTRPAKPVTFISDRES